MRWIKSMSIHTKEDRQLGSPSGSKADVREDTEEGWNAAPDQDAGAQYSTFSGRLSSHSENPTRVISSEKSMEDVETNATEGACPGERMEDISSLKKLMDQMQHQINDIKENETSTLVSLKEQNQKQTAAGTKCSITNAAEGTSRWQR